MQIETKWGTATLVENCIMTGATEQLQWMTELHQAYNGDEDRYMLRDAPRQSFNINLGNGDIFRNDIRGLFAIPLHWCANLALAGTGTTIEVQDLLSPMDLREGYALVDGQVVEILAVDNNNIELAEEITLSQDSVIVPLRICIIDNDALINAGYSRLGYSITFNVLAEDSPYFVSSADAQYKNDDVVLTPILAQSNSIDINVTQHQNIVDNYVGGFQYYTHHDKARHSLPQTYLPKNRQELSDFREFLFRRCGRYRQFWMPQPFKRGEIATDMASRLKDGTWQTGVATTNLDYTCPLALYRFDNDTISIEYLGNNVARSTAVLYEI